MTSLKARILESARCLGVGSALLLAFGLAAAMAVSAREFKELKAFYGDDGDRPQFVTLVQGRDGSYYGTTSVGGAYGYGTVFKITSGGTLTTLYSFCAQGQLCPDGQNPVAGVVLATNGNFYGTTRFGGMYGGGTIFKITPAGKLTTLYSACSQPNCTDGAGYQGSLIQGADGNLYGTTWRGGDYGYGTVFKITRAGVLTTLYSFCSQPGCADGKYPGAGLVQASDGNFYGTTVSDGAGYRCYNCGTVFQITPAGKLTTLYKFSGLDGRYPSSALIQGSDGNLYGTTLSGGAQFVPGGTIFKVTLGGKLTTLYSFCRLEYCSDGEGPRAGLVLATDGNFYGTTAEGGYGAGGGGTAFNLMPNRLLTTLHNFCSEPACSDGRFPHGGLLQATNGVFYGTTNLGGQQIGDGKCDSGCGTVFSISMGLGPFVRLLPTTGKVGKTIGVLGQGLSGTTNVSFNGTSAQFRVASGTFLKATVPDGATTGFVTVTTPGGTLKSNTEFRVLP